jgi:hypothetical protein
VASSRLLISCAAFFGTFSVSAMPYSHRHIVLQEAGNLVAFSPLDEFQIEGKNKSKTTSNSKPLLTYEIIKMCFALVKITY